MSGPVLTPLRRYSFTVCRADFEALQKRFDSRPVSLSLVLAGAVVAGLGWGMTQPDLFGELALLPIIGAAAVVLYGFAHLWRLVRRNWRVARWTPPAGTTQVEQFADRLSVRENARTRIYSWDDIASVSVDDERVYIVQSRDDFVIMPLKAFADRDAMRAFARAFEDNTRDLENADEAEGHGPQSSFPASSSATPSAASLNGDRHCVDVTLTKPDAKAIEAAARRGSPGFVLSLAAWSIASGLAGGVIAGAATWALAGALAPDARLFAGALAAWAGAIGLTFLGARRIESAHAAQWPVDDPRRMTRRIEIDRAGFVLSGADFETRIAWTGVESIRETEQHVLFITSWKEIFAVPKRCFTDADAAHAFANKARACKTAS